jgi:hypothetical protein
LPVIAGRDRFQKRSRGALIADLFLQQQGVRKARCLDQICRCIRLPAAPRNRSTVFDNNRKEEAFDALFI